MQRNTALIYFSNCFGYSHNTYAKYNVLLLIPKLRGEGYLRAPFGGQHSNERYWDFIGEMRLGGDVTDCDGYVSIDLRLSNDGERIKAPEIIYAAVRKVFQQVENFKLTSHYDIMTIVINQQKK